MQSDLYLFNNAWLVAHFSKWDNGVSDIRAVNATGPLQDTSNCVKRPVYRKIFIITQLTDSMIIYTTPLCDLHVIKPSRFGDHRGFFSESWNKSELLAKGLDLPEFVQDNHSLSREIGTVRGLHFQSPPHAQGKLVRCGRGAIFDVAVDVRRGSVTYGQWFSVELSFENGKQLWIPGGFLHGFMTLQEDSEIVYKCTEHYAPECDNAVKWDSCGIDWPIEGISPTISEKDKNAQPFSEFISPFEFEG